MITIVRELVTAYMCSFCVWFVSMCVRNGESFREFHSTRGWHSNISCTLIFILEANVKLEICSWSKDKHSLKGVYHYRYFQISNVNVNLQKYTKIWSIVKCSFQKSKFIFLSLTTLKIGVHNKCHPLDIHSRDS